MSCPTPEVLAAYGEGELSANAMNETTAHVAACASCREENARLTRLRGLLSQPPSPDEAFVHAVVQRSLARERSASLRPALGLVALAAAGVALAVFVPSSSRDDVTGMMARGDALRDVDTFGFAAHARGRRLAAGDEVSAHDALSFTVHNALGRPAYLALVGIDSAGEVHWLYPAWLDADADPVTPALAQDAARLLMPEAVILESPAPGALRLVGLFLAEARRVRELEPLLKDPEALARRVSVLGRSELHLSIRR